MLTAPGHRDRAAGALQIARPLTEVDTSLRHLRLLLLPDHARAAPASPPRSASAGGARGPRARPPADRDRRAGHRHAATSRGASTSTATTRSAGCPRASTRCSTRSRRSQAAQRQLVADASHELRTPLTSLRTNLEVLARGEDLSAAEREHLLSRRRRRARGPVGPGRRPHRAGPRRARSTQTPEECAWTRWPSAPSSGRAGTRPRLRVRRDLRAHASSAAPPARLDRAIGNLLDNAAKWSPPDGVVELTRGGRHGRGPRPRLRHPARGPAVRLRPLLPLGRRPQHARVGPRAWRSSARSPSRTAAP